MLSDTSNVIYLQVCMHNPCQWSFLHARCVVHGWSARSNMPWLRLCSLLRTQELPVYMERTAMSCDCVRAVSFNGGMCQTAAGADGHDGRAIQDLGPAQV